MISMFVERLPTFWLQNNSKRTQVALRLQDLETFRLIRSHSEFVLKQSAATIPSKKTA